MEFPDANSVIGDFDGIRHQLINVAAIRLSFCSCSFDTFWVYYFPIAYFLVLLHITSTA